MYYGHEFSKKTDYSLNCNFYMPVIHAHMNVPDDSYSRRTSI